MTAYDPNLYSATNTNNMVVVNPSNPFIGQVSVPNQYNIEQTPQLQAFNAVVESVPQQVQACEQNAQMAAQQLLQAQHRTGAVGPLGMNGVTSNEYMLPHRTVAMNRPPSNQVFPPLGIPGNGRKQPVVRTAFKNALNHQYCPEMYMTPYDRTPNKVATGVLVNPYTQEVFQTFENGMPPPTKNNSLLPSQMHQTNPKLVSLQGNIDYNAPPPSKQEVAQNVPLINGGPNVWGDALYAPKLRDWFTQRSVMETWNNRNGILPNYGINKEMPAGFVGNVNMLRPMAYNPATMRNAYDLKDWTLGVTDANVASSMDTWNVVQPMINNLDPNRGQAQTFNDALGPVEASVQVPYDLEASIQDLRTTQKTLQEQPVPISNIQPDQVEGYIYNPPDLKATLKLEANAFPYVRVGTNPMMQDNSVYQMQENTELVGTKRQYYSDKVPVSNVMAEQFSAGVQGPQAYAEWTKVAKRGGSNSQQFRVVPNRVTDSLSNQGNFSPGCSQRDVYPDLLREAPQRLQMNDNTAFQTDFTANQQRMLPAQTTCMKKGNDLERDTSMYTMQPMALSMVGQM